MAVPENAIPVALFLTSVPCQVKDTGVMVPLVKYTAQLLELEHVVTDVPLGAENAEVIFNAELPSLK